MSRVLAEILGATEPTFRQQIARLEQAAGLPGADIRLMVQITQETRAKIQELGLDPHDTTGPELYASLQTRLLADEARLREALNISDSASPAELLQKIAHFLEKLDMQTDAFVLKQSVLKQLLKKLQPKATMKKLGYRSMDSMLKHEPAAQLLAATTMCESREWHRQRLEAYKKLNASDFETRKVCFYVPVTKHWPQLAEKLIAEQKNNILTVNEVGAVVILPLTHDLPGLAIMTLLIGLNNLNEIRAQGSYLKLQQVRPDFGMVFHDTLLNEPMTEAEIAGQPLPWKVVQWFYGHGHADYHPEVFEPHVQPDDLQWHDPEDVLGTLHSALEFWQGSQLLALLDMGNPVSLNLLDVALSVCNGLSYGERIVQHMRASLSRELLARYLHQDNLQELLLGKLDQQLAPEISFDV